MSDTPEDNNKSEQPNSDISLISITDEMRRSYLDYAMSVIVSRALPDVRDGLKPVHRRILYSMHENGYEWNKQYRKSARVVGDVIGKYHPHGDTAIYHAMVRMAQDFSMRLPLIDGQGNFGSIDGDMPAAMRYTEVRMERVTTMILEDIDRDTVDFKDNYDNTESEPSILPARFPNLLVNGSGGIAVGMATNIPSHNLVEVIDGAIAIMDNPEITTEELMEIVQGPDFPTAGIILGRHGIRSAYETGRGSVLMRGVVTTEEIRKDREALIITEIPYQVNKATMIEKIAELVRDKRIEGISDIRDESDRNGMRVVIELKRDAFADVVLNQLYRFSPLQTSFGCNFVALNGGKPEQLNLRQILKAFVDFREDVVSRRTKFLLNKARDRAHILVGLVIAVANVDEVISIIRTSPDPATARARLLERAWPAHDVEPLIKLIDDPRHTVTDEGTYYLSEEQVKAILDLRLQRLTALGRDEIGDELNKLGEEIKDYLEILRSRERIIEIIRNEMIEVRDRFGTPRRTQILDVAGDVDDEDLIAREEMVVTVSHGGYIKRVPLSTYRAQRRGGKGRSGMSTRDEDFVARLFVANTHTPVLFFSSRGIVYKLKVWRLPVGAANSRGKALINILPLQEGERITSIMPLPEDEDTWQDLDIMFATKRGTVRRNSLADFVQVNRNGKIAMKLDDGDGIVGVETCSPQDNVLLTTKMGQAMRFGVDEVRVFAGRNSVGVRGIKLADGDEVIAMSILGHFDATSDERTAYLKLRRLIEGDSSEADEDEALSDAEISQERYAEMSAAEQFILAISENGYGKRSSAYEYRKTGRGGKGITAMAMSERNGEIVASFPVENDDQIMLVTNGGKLIRVPVDGIRIAGRATQGVTVLNTAEGEQVVSVERISEPEPDDEDQVDGDDQSDVNGDGKESE
ncbi:DNA gyrase subunit A [Maritalea porphyrae]|uniref:DNA gyrase subunit A n=1 Tax=Maritalea porphyrae TaxID=880732 RepID=UPI0024E0A1BD|nr:DNA gyrase subunit A [Maritalea porphyrae]